MPVDDSGEVSVGTEFGRYLVEERVGAGGMSVLYRATDQRLGRSVALKVMAPKLSLDATFRDRFISEARAASVLDHPNVVPIFEAGESEGRLFIAMRFVPGGADLRKVISAQGQLPVEYTIGVLAQAAAALDAIQEVGMVHRDVKPDNLLLADADASGGLPHVYLTDFGLTRSDGESRLTQAGQVLGTLAYAAPEQIRSEEVDGRADVYSLGCVLFECLAGRRPFVRDNDAALMYAQLTDAPPSLHALRPALPSSIDEVIAMALAKDRDDRLVSCGQLMAHAASACGVPSGVSGPFVLPEVVPHVPRSSVADATATTAPDLRTMAPMTAVNVDVAAPAVAGSSPPPAIDAPIAGRGAGSEGDRGTEPPPSRRGAILIGIGAVALVLVLIGGLVAFARSRGTTSTIDAAWTFPKTSHRSGVTTERTWALAGTNGDRLDGVVVLTNTTSQPRSYHHAEIIPKEVAGSVDQITFEPPPNMVLRADPVVRYDADLPAGGSATFRWRVTVPAEGHDRNRLARWADAWKRDSDAFLASSDARNVDTGDVVSHDNEIAAPGTTGSPDGTAPDASTSSSTSTTSSSSTSTTSTIAPQATQTSIVNGPNNAPVTNSPGPGPSVILPDPLPAVMDATLTIDPASFNPPASGYSRGQAPTLRWSVSATASVRVEVSGPGLIDTKQLSGVGSNTIELCVAGWAGNTCSVPGGSQIYLYTMRVLSPGGIEVATRNASISISPACTPGAPVC